MDPLHVDPSLHPKPLPLTSKWFRANGTLYSVESYALLSPKRMAFVKQLVEALAYRGNPSRLVQAMNQVDSMIGLGQTEEAKLLLAQMLTSLESINTLIYPPDYYVCALFINRENENVDEFDLINVNSKIDDWCKEGFEAYPFHHWSKLFLAQLNN